MSTAADSMITTFSKNNVSFFESEWLNLQELQIKKAVRWRSRVNFEMDTENTLAYRMKIYFIIRLPMLQRF